MWQYAPIGASLHDLAHSPESAAKQREQQWDGWRVPPHSTCTTRSGAGSEQRQALLTLVPLANKALIHGQLRARPLVAVNGRGREGRSSGRCQWWKKRRTHLWSLSTVDEEKGRADNGSPAILAVMGTSAWKHISKKCRKRGQGSTGRQSTCSARWFMETSDLGEPRGSCVPKAIKAGT